MTLNSQLATLLKLVFTGPGHKQLILTLLFFLFNSSYKAKVKLDSNKIRMNAKNAITANLNDSKISYSNFVNNFGFPGSVLFNTTVNKDKISLDLKLTSIELLKNEVPVSKVSSLDNYSRISL